jgi:Regulator of ribonuclease activity B
MMTFPDDDTGDALRRLQAQGDPLTNARNVDFSVVFTSEDAATKFAAYFQSQGYKASVKLTEIGREFPWDVTIVKHMVPSHAAIEAFEDLLQSVANDFGGNNDGWVCFSEPPVH